MDAESPTDGPVTIPCVVCGRPLTRREVVTQTEQSPRFDLYQCDDARCARKVIVVFEPAGGLTPEQQTFVQREIARRGAFFPSDYTGRR